MNTTTYTLWHESPKGPVIFYVGESIDPESRLKQHRRDAADPLNPKEAYEYLRVNGIKGFDMLTVEGTTEDSLYTSLTLAGVKLYNSKRGNASATKKKRDDSFSTLNRAADATMAVKERAEASGRRVVLHSERQSLTKSEITRQRITGEKPTVDALLACQWFDCPVELVSGKYAKTAERASYCKWGDFLILMAFSKDDKTVKCVARDRSMKELWANGTPWTNCSKDRILELLVIRWGSEHAEFA